MSIEQSFRIYYLAVKTLKKWMKYDYFITDFKMI